MPEIEPTNPESSTADSPSAVSVQLDDEGHVVLPEGVAPGGDDHLQYLFDALKSTLEGKSVGEGVEVFHDAREMLGKDFADSLAWASTILVSGHQFMMTHPESEPIVLEMLKELVSLQTRCANDWTYAITRADKGEVDGAFEYLQKSLLAGKELELAMNVLGKFLDSNSGEGA